MGNAYKLNDGHATVAMVILDGIDDAVVELDGQAKFAVMNQAAVNIYQRLGLDPQSMKGRSVWQVFPDLKGTIIERELRQVLDDHVQVNYEFYYLKINTGTKQRAIQLPQEPFWCFGTLRPEKAPHHPENVTAICGHTFSFS